MIDSTSLLQEAKKDYEEENFADSLRISTVLYEAGEKSCDVIKLIIKNLLYNFTPDKELVGKHLNELADAITSRTDITSQEKYIAWDELNSELLYSAYRADYYKLSTQLDAVTKKEDIVPIVDSRNKGFVAYFENFLVAELRVRGKLSLSKEESSELAKQSNQEYKELTKEIKKEASRVFCQSGYNQLEKLDRKLLQLPKDASFSHSAYEMLVIGVLMSLHFADEEIDEIDEKVVSGSETITNVLIDKYGDIENARNVLMGYADIHNQYLNKTMFENGRARSVVAGLEGRNDYIKKIEKCYKFIKKIDPSFNTPMLPSSAPIGESAPNGGCYVATAVYGSYDCPQVWTLRRYRDNTLAESWYGRAFIRLYYAISPTLVRWFGNTEWFQTMWRGKLDKMVAKLQANGVESTPYEDKIW